MMLRAILRQHNLESTKVSFILCFYLLILDGKSQSVQLLSHVWLSATPWTAARQASLSITNSRSLLKLMSIELVMPSNYLILCCPLLFLPLIFPSNRVFSSESTLCIRWPEWGSRFRKPGKYWLCELGYNLAFQNEVKTVYLPFHVIDIHGIDNLLLHKMETWLNNILHFIC